MPVSDLSDLEVLSLTIYGEARGELIEGQIAVGCVIRNRVRVGEYASYRAACLAPKQFSCWNADDPNFSVLKELGDKMLYGQKIADLALTQCQWVAAGIVSSAIMDNTHSATHYMTTKLYNDHTVPWAQKLKIAGIIGNQTFLA
jgi:hypothetical protein